MKKKKIAIDASYKEDSAYTVGVIFSSWDDTEPEKIIDCTVKNPGPYIPGEFYKRELKCILELLKLINLEDFDTIIVDGFIWIKKDGELTEGLGARLWQELNNSDLSIIGVAKSPFSDCSEYSCSVYRGTGITPLYVQGVGKKMDNKKAGNIIKNMGGQYKLPDILKTLDKKTKS
jgi:deoxyribonuclease V